MAGDDADFAAYLTARWPSVVRTLALFGATPQDAERLARDSLARCHDSWKQVRRSDDVDAHVYGVVVRRWHRCGLAPPTESAAARDPGQTSDVAPVLVLEGAAEDDLALRRELEAELARLAPEQREALVLRFVAGLDDEQVAEALDIPFEAARRWVSDGLAGLDLTRLQELLR